MVLPEDGSFQCLHVPKKVGDQTSGEGDVVLDVESIAVVSNTDESVWLVGSNGPVAHGADAQFERSNRSGRACTPLLQPFFPPFSGDSSYGA